MYFSTNSVKELEAFAENAIAVNRLILRHLSISEAYSPMERPKFAVGETDDGPLFDKDMYGGREGHSEEEYDCLGELSDEAPILWMGLSPPGGSGLAKRRADKRRERENSESSSDNSNDSNDCDLTLKAAPSLMPRVQSSMF